MSDVAPIDIDVNLEKGATVCPFYDHAYPDGHTCVVIWFLHRAGIPGYSFTLTCVPHEPAPEDCPLRNSGVVVKGV